MKSSRTPFGQQLEELIETLVNAILEAMRGASLGDLAEGRTITASAKSASRASSDVERRAPPPIAAADRAKRAPRRNARVAPRRAEAPSSVRADEWHDEPAGETEIDAVALLDSLERPAPRPAPEPRAKPEAVVEPRPTMTRPTLRSGEDVLQTTTGSVVLRRRRAASSDE